MSFSHEIRDYHAVDADPLPEISYYRLKQTDYDKKFSYTPVVRVVNKNLHRPTLIVYPNPSEATGSVFIKLNTEKYQRTYTVISDPSGRIFFSGEINLTSEVNIRHLNLKYELTKGFYIIHVSSGGFKDTHKFIIY